MRENPHPAEAVEKLAEQYEAVLIRSRDELRAYNGTRKGLLNGLRHDISAIPDLVLLLGAHARARIMKNLNGHDSNSEIQRTSGVYLIPGFGSFNGHLKLLSDALDGVSRHHRHFDQMALDRTIFEDVDLLSSDIAKERAPVSLAAHSRGGLLTLCLLRRLEKMGLSNLVTRVFLMAPTSHGLRDEVAAMARFVPSKAIRDMCPGSEAILYWQDLKPDTRAKVNIIIPQGGDTFTSPERAFVDGGTMLLTGHCGHQAQIRDPESDFFRLAVELIKGHAEKR